MKKNTNMMKVEWAWINAHSESTSKYNEVSDRWNRKETVPAHFEVNKSLDVKTLNFEGMKVAVAFCQTGFQSFLFKALEKIQFTEESGSTGDLADFLEEPNQKMELGFKVHDESGRYEVKLWLVLEGTARKLGDDILPNYLVVTGWNVGAPEIR